MKTSRVLLILLLFFSLCGCTKQEIVEESVSYESTEVHGESAFVFEDITIPTALGYPELNDEELLSLSLEDLKEKGVCYIDLVRYIKLNKEKLNPGEIGKKYIEVLAKYYDEAGLIRVSTNKGSGYDYIYVKKDGSYYPLDLCEQSQENKGWFSDYKDDKYVCASIDETLNTLSKNFPYMKSGDSVNDISYTIATPINIYTIETKDGKSYKAQNRLDIDVYYLNGIQVPVGLGLPEYSNEEIDQMIANPDKSGVADKIHTIADAINYVTRAGFIFDDYHNTDYGDYTLIDVGNVVYKGGEFMTYSLSGLEILQLERAQCSGMSTLFNYLLYGDYPEVGYCNIPRHAFMYIKGHDNKYYLVDPVQYVLDDAQYKTWFNENNFTKISSDTADGLMGNIMEAGWLNTYYVIYWTYDGTFSFWSGNFDVPEEFLRYPLVFPEGSDAHIYGQNLEIKYVKPKHETSHDHILGVKF